MKRVHVDQGRQLLDAVVVRQIRSDVVQDSAQPKLWQAPLVLDHGWWKHSVSANYTGGQRHAKGLTVNAAGRTARCCLFFQEHCKSSNLRVFDANQVLKLNLSARH